MHPTSPPHVAASAIPTVDADTCLMLQNNCTKVSYPCFSAVLLGLHLAKTLKAIHGCSSYLRSLSGSLSKRC